MTALQIALSKCLEIMTEQALADRLRVSLPTIQRWSSGKSAPHQTLDMVQILEDIASGKGECGNT